MSELDILLLALSKDDDQVSDYLGEVRVKEFRAAIAQLQETNVDRNKLITALNILKTI